MHFFLHPFRSPTSPNSRIPQSSSDPTREDSTRSTIHHHPPPSGIRFGFSREVSCAIWSRELWSCTWSMESRGTWSIQLKSFQDGGGRAVCWSHLFLCWKKRGMKKTWRKKHGEIIMGKKTWDKRTNATNCINRFQSTKLKSMSPWKKIQNPLGWGWIVGSLRSRSLVQLGTQLQAVLKLCPTLVQRIFGGHGWFGRFGTWNVQQDTWSLNNFWSNNDAKKLLFLDHFWRSKKPPVLFNAQSFPSIHCLKKCIL